MCYESNFYTVPNASTCKINEKLKLLSSNCLIQGSNTFEAGMYIVRAAYIRRWKSSVRPLPLKQVFQLHFRL